MKNLKTLIGTNWHDSETMAYYVGYSLGLLKEREDPKNWWEDYFDEQSPVINMIYDIIGGYVYVGLLEAGENGKVNENWDPIGNDWYDFRWNPLIESDYG